MKIEKKELNEKFCNHANEEIQVAMRSLYSLYVECQKYHNMVFPNQITSEMIAFLFAKYFYHCKSGVQIAANEWLSELTQEQQTIMYRFSAASLLYDLDENQNKS